MIVSGDKYRDVAVEEVDEYSLVGEQVSSKCAHFLAFDTGFVGRRHTEGSGVSSSGLSPA